MTDRSTPASSTSRLSSSAFLPAARPQTADSSSMRPRNRRLISTDDDGRPASVTQDSSLLSGAFSQSAAPGSGASPRRTTDSAAGSLGQFLGDSWTQSWVSVQALTSSLLAGSDGQGKAGAPSQGQRLPFAATSNNKSSVSWGPLPPSNPGLSDVAAGSLADRETALKAAKTASVLESHDGVNGGLDVTGKHKRRNSSDHAVEDPLQEDYLVYIHQIRPTDTYAGLILRYKCREDALRKANGLWSRDSVQTRKWLVVPVDTCEIRGRPCDPPSWQNPTTVDLLAPTPLAADERKGKQPAQDYFFSQSINENSETAGQTPQAEEEEKLWTHVRWVKIDSFQQPVEIGRVSRQAMGYFPPRRRKSIRTISSLSTPRQSLDLGGGGVPGSSEARYPRRQSSASGRPQLPGTPHSSRSRVGSDVGDGRPAWMRRPGGVGSMGRSVRAPGPDKDYLNAWTNKHIPVLNIDGLPSMSVMGSETANFGFSNEAPNIVESPFEEGRDIASTSRQGTGLDKAALAVETWLRGALARRPGTPILGGRARSKGRYPGDADGDLIELADTGSEDGRLAPESAVTIGAMNSTSVSSSRSGGGASVRGRAMPTGLKGPKAE